MKVTERVIERMLGFLYGHAIGDVHDFVSEFMS